MVSRATAHSRARGVHRTIFACSLMNSLSRILSSSALTSPLARSLFSGEALAACGQQQSHACQHNGQARGPLEPTLPQLSHPFPFPTHVVLSDTLCS